MSDRLPKNYRNGADDVSPPIEHADLRPCMTVMRVGNRAVLLDEGPRLVHIKIEEGEINAEG